MMPWYRLSYFLKLMVVGVSLEAAIGAIRRGFLFGWVCGVLD